MERDFAYFAARLGWSIDDYLATTPVQRAFVRKEIERETVNASNLMKSAVEIAVANCLGKKKRRLWRKVGKSDPAIAQADMSALQLAMSEKVPWTPWNGKGVGSGEQ